jgi:replicative DNA helicase
MSSGLNFISAAISRGAGTSLLQIDESLMVDEQERAAFEFARQYYRSHREVPTPTILQEQTGIRLPRADGAVEFYLEDLYDRDIYEVLRGTWGQFREGMAEGTPGPVVELLEDTVRRVRRRRRGGSLIDIHQGMQLSIDRLREAMLRGGLSGVPSPWPTFNEQSGGMQPADLITYVGRSGMGKTALLLAQAEGAYDAGFSVLFVTSEMSSEQITRRWMAHKFGLNPKHMKLGTISTHTLRRMEQMQAELLGRERFRLLSLGTGARLAAIDAAIEECRPDLVLIDGIYLFYPSKGGHNMKQTERVTQVFDELKQQTIDTNLPHIVTTQFNRAAGKGGKDGSLETIGLSDAIGWHSSIVVAVKHGPTENPLHSRELEFLKGREGEEGKFAINFKFKPVDFSEMTPAQLSDIADDQPLNTVAVEWS